MFKKVLIAEDHEMVNISVRNTLTNFGVTITNNDVAFHCDTALTRIQKALKAKQPYELLITDLSFSNDGYDQNIFGGEELIKAIKQEQPDIKILVFSIEHREIIVDFLFKELGIDAFVPKARNDAKDLKSAIEAIYKDQKYRSPNLKQAEKEEYTHNFTDKDKRIIFLLANGEPQKNIPFYLKKEGFSATSLRSFENTLSTIKKDLNISSNEQLIAYCKDKNII